MSSSNLSRLERLRQENIERNEAFLALLGLDTVTIPTTTTTTTIQNENIYQKKQNNKSRRRQQQQQQLSSEKENNSSSSVNGNQNSSSSRRSSRLNKKKPKLLDTSMPLSSEQEEDVNQFSLDNNGYTRVGSKSKGRFQTDTVSYDEDDEDGTIRNPITAPSLRTFIESLNQSHSEDISNNAIVHCVDRIKSMSNRALATRVNAISSGSGKTSREKLLVFYYALKMCGLVKLESAAASNLHAKWN
jgi:hypothetical protein